METQSQLTKQLLTIKDVMAITGFAESTVYKFVKNGTLPKPKKFGRSSRWLMADIEQHINAQS